MTGSHVGEFSRSPGGAGEMLRGWRRKRGLSQADLAEHAEVSTRHLSCLETGKARPSREMLLVLGSALDLPLRERNLLLQVGGHGSAYPESDLGSPEMAGVRDVLELILQQSEPNPAVVANGAYELVSLNRSMAALAAWLGMPPGGNLMRVVFEDLRPHIVNWPAVAGACIDRLHREALHTGHPGLVALLDELRPLAPEPTWNVPPIALPVVLQKDGVQVSLFTTLTSLGTPTDVTVADLRIETYYAMDDASRAFLDRLTPPAGGGGTSPRRAGSP